MPARTRLPIAPSVGLLALSLAACAHHPSPDLLRAEGDVRAAEADPLVAEHAPLLLQDARADLERAQRADRRGADEAELDHLAYLASRRVEIARVSAEKHDDLERAAELAREPAPVVVVTPLPEPSVGVEEVFFAPERSAISEPERTDLARVASLIIEHPGRSVRIDGHADASERDALDLSEERASEVARTLIEEGVPPARIVTRGFGATVPAASDATAAGRERNRRVEVVLETLVGAR
jgi:outer membrane protein OmpA-like peptidoglycan-associated protein